MSNLVRNRLSKKITSLSLDKETLRKLLGILQKRADSACDIEYKNMEAQLPPENLDKFKENLESCRLLKITIIGDQNDELFGTIEDVFNSVSFPDSVKTLYLNSELAYRTLFKYYPANSFELHLDFSKPTVFDFSIQPSERTPNESKFEVQGSDNTWVNGVFHEINSYMANNASKFPGVHKGSIYDTLVWIFGLPFGFWLCYKVIKLNIDFLNAHSFLESVLLTYLFFLSLFILRVLFHYFRWVYPMIEYKSKKNRSVGHQAALLSITLGLLGKFFYDIMRILINL